LGNLNELPEVNWLEPIPERLVVPGAGDPAETAVVRDSVRLAFVAALQHLPPRQRAALILCEVLQWQAGEVAELLETSTASINSALQRARATLQAGKPTSDAALSPAERELLARYVKAFEAYDVNALTALIHEDAKQSMPPYDMWLAGREDIFAWWFGPGIGCKGSRVLPAESANGLPTFGQYKPSPNGGFEPWALQVIELRDGVVGELTFFLNTKTLFPLFGLPPRLDD
jgi:RNA polymerase sigma-70 factor (ECF subfamily)